MYDLKVVRLACGTEFKSYDEKSFLASALAQDVVLKHSCFNGQCGVCKASVVKGATGIIQEELALSKEEREAGKILTCCRMALTNVELDVAGLKGFPSSKVLPCKIDKLEVLKSDVLKVRLRFPPGNNFFYLPGQYVDVVNKWGIRRSYSIANALCSNGRVELYIRRLKGGEMSNYWFEEAQENDLLRLEGPFGTFVQHELPVKNIIFLATGTGMAPVKAMLETINSKPELANKANYYFYWGGRCKDDFFWNPEFGSIDLYFNPVLSGSEKNWVGHKGYVQEALLADGINLKQSVIYACGSERMITAARETLISQGLCEDNFYSDAFVSSGN